MDITAKKEWSLFFRRVVIFLLGIAVPIVSFVFSDALKADWKGGTKFGFLSLLVSSKIVLLPLVVWATISFFRTQIYPRQESKRWEMVGLGLGTIVAVFSLISGFFAKGIELLWFAPSFLSQFFRNFQNTSVSDVLGLFVFFPLVLAPLYTPLWYGWATWSALSKRKQKTTRSVVTDVAIISLPFMSAALIYARRLYENLPDAAPGCYIVSATALTPTRFIATIIDPSNGRLLSRQLLIFKAFEYAWIASNGSSHAIFRFFYNG